MKFTQRCAALCVLVFLFCTSGSAQISGTFTVPIDFPTIAAAVNTLNLLGVAGPVTVYVNAAHTETAPVGGIKLNNVTGSSAVNTVLFQKTGAGANPKITAYTGTATPATFNAQDGVWWLIGADYITIDGIDIYDPNTTNPATMEFGYGLYMQSGSNGCQNNTIKNCTVSLNRVNSVAGTGIVTGGCRGIDIVSASYTNNVTSLGATTAAGAHFNNKFYSNLIQNCQVGISITGNGSTSFPNLQTDIGGNSAVTGNTITNFGGFSGSEAVGIRTYIQGSQNVSFNTVINNDGSGQNPATPLSAIRTAFSGSNIVNSNTIILSSSATSTNDLFGVVNDGGGGIHQINNNVFPSFQYTTGISTSCVLIYNLSTGTISISGNLIRNVRNGSGDLKIIRSNSTGTCSVNSNTLINIFNDGYSLVLLDAKGIYTSVSNNLIDSIVSNATISSSLFYGIDVTGSGSGTTSFIQNNVLRNIQASAFRGITTNNFSAFLTISGNQIYNISNVPTYNNGLYFFGMDLLNSSTANATISANSIYSITSVGSGTNNFGSLVGIVLDDNSKIFQNRIGAFYSNSTGSITGIRIEAGSHDINNNVIGDFVLPNSSRAEGITGIYMHSYPNSQLYYNSVYLNSPSSGVGFGSAALVLSSNTTGTITARNNILLNTSVSTGTGITAVIKKKSGSLFLGTASNNNLLYAGVPSANNIIFDNGTTTYSTLTAYKSLTSPKEAQSVTENVPFLITNGNSTGFLTINPSVPTQVENLAVPITGYTFDYSGITRHVSTPDIGAREGVYTQADVSPPAIVSSGFITNDCSLSGRTMTVNLIDVSGVASGTATPRIYYRVNFGLYSSTQGTLSSGTATNGVWTFQMNYSASPGATIRYFIALQDISPLNNFTLNPTMTGATVTDINTIIVPPTTTHTYAIIPATGITVNSGTICSGQDFTLSPSGATTYSFEGGSALVSPSVSTNYTVIGFSSSGCQSSNTAVASLTVHALPVVSAANGTICSGQTFTILATGADTYTYQGGSAFVSPLNSNSYTVAGTNTLTGCISTVTSVQVDVNITPTVSVNSGSVCAGSVFTIQPTGAGSYVISGNSTTVSPLTNTVYLVTGTGTNGCLSANTATSVVTAIALPTVSVNSGTLCSGKSFTLNPTGAFGYTYEGGSAVVSPLANTSYTISGTSIEGCFSASSATAFIMVVVSPTITVNSGTICSGQTFSILASGADSYVYQGGSSTVSPLSTTSYSVVGTNTTGCVSAAVFAQVSVNITPTVSVNSGSICFGNVFTIVPSGADSYVISGGSSTVSPLTNSVYLVTGTATNGCVSANTATSAVTVFSLPVVSVNSGTLCSGKSFTLSASGAASYIYEGGSPVVNPLTNTNYTVTGTSVQGCASANTATAAVSVIATPSITVNSGTICSGETFSIVPSGANSYNYEGGLPSVNPGSTRSYSVTGMDLNGCVSDPVLSNIYVNVSPTISVNSGSVCLGNTFTIVPAGADTYTISGNTATVSPVTSSLYLVTGTATNGCVSVNTVTSNVTVMLLPTVGVNGGTLCSGKSFTLIGTGAASYSYQGGSSVVSPVTSSTYTISGLSAEGCLSSNTATALITVLSTPTIAVNSGTICSGQSFSMLPSGATSYSYEGGVSVVSPLSTRSYSVVGTNSTTCISDVVFAQVSVNITPTVSVNNGTICAGKSFTILPTGAGVYNISGNTATVSPLTTTIYLVTGTGTNGCVSVNTATATVVVNPLPTISISGGTLCSGKSFTLNPTGADTYNFPNNTAIVSPLTNSSYPVSGTSSLGCASSNTAIATLTVLSSPTVVVNSGTICAGNSFTLFPSGAGGYSISGNPIAIGSATVSPLTNTVYMVTGTGTNGCVSSNTAIASVTVHSLPVITVNSGSICIGGTFSINPGGGASYTFLNGASTVSPVSNTSYSITGLSAEGCVSSNTAVSNVTVEALPNLSVGGGSVCSGSSFTLTVTGANSYSWSQGGTASTSIVSPVVTTPYSVTGTNVAGCTAVTTVTVYTHPLPVISISPTSASVCLQSSVSFTASGAVNYTWTGGPQTAQASFTPVAATVYTVTGLDANLCLGSQTVGVISYSLPVLTVAQSAGSVCAFSSVSYTASGASSYSWSTGAAQPVITYSAGAGVKQLTVTGTNTTGCSSFTTVSLHVFALPAVSITPAQITLCLGDSIELAASGALTYSWLPDGNTMSVIKISPTVNTSYVLEGKDANSCSATITAQVDVSDCTGFAEENKNAQLVFYPNPFESSFSISVSGVPALCQLEIVDNLGRSVLTRTLTLTSEEIIMRDLAKGIYHVRIMKDQRVLKTSKVIKQ